MTDTQKTSPLLPIAGTYALILCAGILVGLPGAFGEGSDYPGKAVRMPAVAALIALVCGASGLGLFRRQNWARFAFLVAAPWGSIALGSVFAPSLWRADVPDTAIAIFVYVPAAFVLARRSALQSLGVADVRWASRGGGFVLALAALMFVARLMVVASGPSAGGGFIGMLHGLNAYVQRLVLCDVPLWNYLGALIAVSIPTRSKDAPKSEDRALAGASKPGRVSRGRSGLFENRGLGVANDVPPLAEQLLHLGDRRTPVAVKESPTPEAPIMNLWSRLFGSKSSLPKPAQASSAEAATSSPVPHVTSPPAGEVARTLVDSRAGQIPDRFFENVFEEAFWFYHFDALIAPILNTVKDVKDNDIAACGGRILKGSIGSIIQLVRRAETTHEPEILFLHCEGSPVCLLVTAFPWKPTDVVSKLGALLGRDENTYEAFVDGGLGRARDELGRKRYKVGVSRWLHIMLGMVDADFHVAAGRFVASHIGHGWEAYCYPRELVVDTEDKYFKNAIPLRITKDAADTLG